MAKQRIMLMSGFLGSGKTTGMVAMANELKRRGMETGLITNDLGSNLVDTSFVERAGFPVLEISNGCLCHDVDQLVEKLNAHIAGGNPEIILFEPVGSCVDMVNHVYRDIKERFDDLYELAPVTALVDPVRYQAIYMGIGEDTFPDQISYMFRKQLEEADLLLVSKADALDGDEVEAIEESIRENFPGIPTFAISSLENENIDRWADYVLSHTSSLVQLDIDMDYVMAGAAKMGWYNWVCDASIPKGADVAALCDSYLRAVKASFEEAHAEIAHAKVIATQGDAFCRVALTSKNGTPSTLGSLGECSGDVRFNINIRAVMEPQAISELMETHFRAQMESAGARIVHTELQAFRSAEEPPEVQTA